MRFAAWLRQCLGMVTMAAIEAEVAMAVVVAKAVAVAKAVVAAKAVAVANSKHLRVDRLRFTFSEPDSRAARVCMSAPGWQSPRNRKV